MVIIFWISFFALSYTYIGYPVYVFVRSRIAKNPVAKDTGYKPVVSVIMSAYNERPYVERKIKNLLSSGYPKEGLEILVGSDGSTDGTDLILGGIRDDNVKTFIYKERRGKPGVLNDLVSRAKGEILIFCDVRQLFEKDAISQLAANFADSKIGCVSGELVFEKPAAENDVAACVNAYWDYEKFVRECESMIHSMVGATGAIYAIRRELFRPLPADIILDDVYTPLAIARRGYRAVWDGEAKAYDRPALTAAEEYRRKVRTLTGNYQIFRLFSDLLVPFRNPVSPGLISHKLLRVLAPFFMITFLLSNIFIAKEGYYAFFLISQIIFYIFAMLGGMSQQEGRKRPLVKMSSVAYMFCVMNFAALAGLYRFIFGKQKIAWEK